MTEQESYIMLALSNSNEFSFWCPYGALAVLDDCPNPLIITSKSLKKNNNQSISQSTILEINQSINQINVVPRSTGNTNSGTREFSLKCQFKCYFKPINNPLGVSPSKGKQGTTRGKEKIF